MPKILNINIDQINLSATLNDSSTAQLIWDSLPIEGVLNVWGKEIYFSTPLQTQTDSDATDIVNQGSVAYWPPGNALCIFWGPTPASTGDECRAASPVNIVGAINEDLEILNSVHSGTKIILSKL
tara:strand:+ start:10967 stop:11341 length:375 start_codon:yes stop_codon:yes gene_type:complete